MLLELNCEFLGYISQMSFWPLCFSPWKAIYYFLSILMLVAIIILDEVYGVSICGLNKFLLDQLEACCWLFLFLCKNVQMFVANFVVVVVKPSIIT